MKYAIRTTCKLVCCISLLSPCAALGQQGPAKKPIVEYNNEQGKKKKQNKNITYANAAHNATETSKELTTSVVMPTPVTTEDGFGMWRTLTGTIWGESTCILTEMREGTFKVENGSFHRKANTVARELTKAENDSQLTELLEVWRENYRHTVKLEDTPACSAYLFLTKQNEHKQASLKKMIQETDQTIIKKTNESLEELKKMMKTHLSSMNEQLETHKKSQTEEIQKECNESRRLEKGCLDACKLNKYFVLPGSQRRPDQEENRNTNPEKVDNLYTNEYILTKIQISRKRHQTLRSVAVLLGTLEILSKQLEDIKELSY